MSVSAVVLAGGKSKRFRSKTPKVLHPLLGRTLIGHVLHTLTKLRLEGVVVVTPPGGLPLPGVRLAVQEEPLGSGDAARIGLEAVPPSDIVLVVAGDMPLVRHESLTALVRACKTGASVLTAELEDPAAYGRVIRKADRVVEIVEARDASPEQLAIREVNTSVYAFATAELERVLPKLGRDNAQREYYLTDAVRLLVEDGARVSIVRGESTEGLGTNTRADLAEASRAMRARILDALMTKGVTVSDPSATYVDATVKVGADATLLPGTILEAATRIGAGCVIGPSTRIVDSTVGPGAHVTYSVAEGVRIARNARVGPFAHLRAANVPGSR